VNALAVVVLAGPATVAAGATTAVRSWTPDRIASAATAALGGVVAAIVLDERLAVTVLPLVLLGPAAAIVDVHENRLPDVLTATMFAATLPLAITSGAAGWEVSAAAALTTLGLLVLKTAAPGAIGWGDLKFAPTVAIVLGQHAAVLPGLLCIVGLIALTAVAVAVQGRATSVPYGPALLLGTLTAVI
jgi:leader peptidase (prepilin peptidase)/N-methyltransferase